MRSLIRRFGKATSIIYFLVHIVLLLLGVIANAQGGAFWTAIGTSLIATSVAGFVLYVYVDVTDAERQNLKALSTSGIEAAYPQRAAQIRQEYQSRLERAGRKVDIMGFGLRDFARDYMSELGTLANRATVRILLLDPTSDSASRKDNEEGRGVGSTANEINEFIRRFKESYPSGHSNLEVRTYACLPSVNIFRIDNELFWGPYLVGRESANSVTLRVRGESELFDQLSQHFESVWVTHSTPI